MGIFITRFIQQPAFDLPDDVVLSVIKHCHAGAISDKHILHMLSTVCRQFNKIIRAHRDEIIAAFIVKIRYRYYTVYTLYGQRHNIGDLPAAIYDNGRIEWWKNGQLHRDSGPAVVKDAGSQFWYRHGKLHRDGDLPAVVTTGGLLQWCQHGLAHRDGDQPAVITEMGIQIFYQHGVVHRVNNGPVALRPDGSPHHLW